MRKFIVTALVAGLAAAGAVLIPAQANSDCPTGPSGLTVPPTGSGTLTVGINDGPVQGCVTASGSAETQSGYIVADGKSGNPDPFDGYIGVEGDSGGQRVVGCASNDYDPNAAQGSPQRNVVTPIPPDPNNPPNPTQPGPCSAAPGS